MEPSVSNFLLMYPEFNDPKFTDSLINVWFNQALTVVNAKRWGSQYAFGVHTLTAHYLSVYACGNHEVEGLLTTNTVDGVTYSVDVALVTNEDGASFNASKYGVQYWQLAKMRGTGPLSALASRPCF